MQTLSDSRGCRIVARAMKTPPLPLWRMPRSRYEQLVGAGFGPGDRVELLDGLLIAREPHGECHTAAPRARIRVAALLQ
jgi:hypothetical protein